MLNGFARSFQRVVEIIGREQLKSNNFEAIHPRMIRQVLKKNILVMVTVYPRLFGQQTRFLLSAVSNLFHGASAKAKG